MATVGKVCKLGIDTRISLTKANGRCKNIESSLCWNCGFYNECDRRKPLLDLNNKSD